MAEGVSDMCCTHLLILRMLNEILLRIHAVRWGKHVESSARRCDVCRRETSHFFILSSGG